MALSECHSPADHGDMELSTTPRTRLGRHSERARAERAELYRVLDEALICHLGVAGDGPADAPMVLPTCFGYHGDTLYLHGSTGARSLRGGSGAQVCITVSLVDGLVYSRSVFSHSANFRSAVIYGTARPVTDPEEKLLALEAIVEHTTPGSWSHARRPSRKELAATAVLAVGLAEASVKARGGPPVDEEGDIAEASAWAGVLPVRLSFGTPEPCPRLPASIPVPQHVRNR